jgi:DNA polymerase IV (archaeal DinB-like DNA polymerase)
MISPDRSTDMTAGPANQYGSGSLSEPAHRIILHLDMDSFYASVEMRERPEIRGKPVVVGADPKNGKGRGVVATCSYEARAFGIRSAMPISQAFALCPHAVFLPPDFSRYTQASGDVMAILRSYGFPIQQVSIDEAFLDISRVESFSAARDLCSEIKKTIRTRLGLNCSIGVGPGKIVAKIASDFRKPDGLTVVEPEDLSGFLAPLPVRKIPGIGKKTEAELFEIGIKTIGDLARYDSRSLIGHFGQVAVFLQDSARGIDDSRVEERDGMKSVSRERTFENDTSDTQAIFQTMDVLAHEVHQSLVEGQFRFRTVTVKVRYTGFITRTKARTLSHGTDDERVIRTCAQALLRETIDDRKIRLLGLRLSSLEKRDARQTTLS